MALFFLLFLCIADQSSLLMKTVFLQLYRLVLMVFKVTVQISVPFCVDFQGLPYERNRICLIFKFLPILFPPSPLNQCFKKSNKIGTIVCNKIYNHCCYKSEVRQTRMGIKLSRSTFVNNGTTRN